MRAHHGDPNYFQHIKNVLHPRQTALLNKIKSLEKSFPTIHEKISKIKNPIVGLSSLAGGVLGAKYFYDKKFKD